MGELSANPLLALRVSVHFAHTEPVVAPFYPRLTLLSIAFCVSARRLFTLAHSLCFRELQSFHSIQVSLCTLHH